MGGSDDSHALVGEFPALFGGHLTLTGAQVAIAVGDIHKVDIHTCLGKGVHEDVGGIAGFGGDHHMFDAVFPGIVTGQPGSFGSVLPAFVCEDHTLPSFPYRLDLSLS